MKVTRTGQRRAAAINSVKVLLTSSALAATLVGWAAISTSNGSALAVAQATTTSTTVQSWLASRGIPATANTASNATVTTTSNQVVAQPNIRTRSSR